MKRFSAWGYLLFAAWGLCLGLASGGARLVALLGLELAFGLAWSRDGLRVLRRLRLWVLLAAAVAVGPFLDREAGLASVAVSVSWVGIQMGLEMAGRALALTLAFSLGMSPLSLSDILAMFDRLHLRGLGFALGVAMNLLGTLQEMAAVTFQTIKLRGGLRRPVLALRLFLVTLVSNTLRYGDQVVNAASVRAFDPNGYRDSTSHLTGPLRRADLWLLLALAVAGALLLTLRG